MNKEDRFAFQVTISPERHRKLRLLSAYHGRTMKALVTEFVDRAYVETFNENERKKHSEKES